MYRFFAIFAFIITLVFALSCTKSVTEPVVTGGTVQIMTVTDLPADTAAKGNFTFFSFKNNAIVQRTDSNTAKWDIAFAATKIITNDGVRGPGLGGAIVLMNTDFTSLKKAPDTTYATEQSLTQTAIMTGSGNGWYNYDPNAHIISPIPGNVLIIKCADGKFAKLVILSYYKGAPAVITDSSISKYYKFQFGYQGDGTKNF
ncbi:MAG: HmuY family protein [FCB group bacterium]|jgi:hypothetical protein